MSCHGPIYQSRYNTTYSVFHKPLLSIDPHVRRIVLVCVDISYKRKLAHPSYINQSGPWGLFIYNQNDSNLYLVKPNQGSNFACIQSLFSPDTSAFLLKQQLFKGRISSRGYAPVLNVVSVLTHTCVHVVHRCMAPIPCRPINQITGSGG